MKKINYLLLVTTLMICIFGEARSATADPSDINLRQGPYLVLANDDNWKWSPEVAYDFEHNVYLVVWEDLWPGTNHHNIYGTMVTPSGTFLPEFLIYDGIYNSMQPAVAYDSFNDQFLVVWAYDSAGDGTDNDIYGRFVPWNMPSLPYETEFGVETSRNNTDKPRLAYSPISDEFLIVWKVEDDPSYIAGGIIKSNKTGFPVDISRGPEVRDFPDVTYNQAANDFLVAWDVDVSRETYDLDIFAIRIYANGAPVPPGEFPISTLLQVEERPSVAACHAANQYFIVWQQQVNPTSTDYNIFGRMMSISGDLTLSYGVAGTTLPQRHPRVACNSAGSEYLLAWDDMYAQPYLRVGIWAEAVSTNFWVQPAFEVVRPSDMRDRLYPAVAYGKVSALVVWQHARENSGYLDIWAQVVQPHAIFIPMVKR
jgi:hypothetical protein